MVSNCESPYRIRKGCSCRRRKQLKVMLFKISNSELHVFSIQMRDNITKKAIFKPQRLEHEFLNCSLHVNLTQAVTYVQQSLDLRKLRVVQTRLGRLKDLLTEFNKCFQLSYSVSLKNSSTLACRLLSLAQRRPCRSSHSSLSR